MLKDRSWLYAGATTGVLGLVLGIAFPAYYELARTLVSMNVGVLLVAVFGD